MKAPGAHFSSILDGFWNHFLMYVLHVFAASINKENVVSILCLLCFQHIDLFHKEETSMENQHIFEDTSGKSLEIGFWIHLRWILEDFWHPLGSKMQKNRGPKNIKKMMAENV